MVRGGVAGWKEIQRSSRLKRASGEKNGEGGWVGRREEEREREGAIGTAVPTLLLLHHHHLLLAVLRRATTRNAACASLPFAVVLTLAVRPLLASASTSGAGLSRVLDCRSSQARLDRDASPPKPCLQRLEHVTCSMRCAFCGPFGDRHLPPPRRIACLPSPLSISELLQDLLCPLQLPSRYRRTLVTALPRHARCAVAIVSTCHCRICIVGSTVCRLPLGESGRPDSSRSS